ncbi:MAG: hypothetical protein QXO40_02855 [Candidatus Aenigmatarchaeota archaeon]
MVNLFFLIPGYSYKFYSSKKYLDIYYKYYTRRFYTDFLSGISASFLIKDLDLKIRILNPFLKFHYYNELYLKISDKKTIEKKKTRGVFLDSQLLKGPIIISLLIKIL